MFLLLAPVVNNSGTVFCFVYDPFTWLNVNPSSKLYAPLSTENVTSFSSSPI